LQGTRIGKLARVQVSTPRLIETGRAEEAASVLRTPTNAACRMDTVAGEM